MRPNVFRAHLNPAGEVSRLGPWSPPATGPPPPTGKGTTEAGPSHRNAACRRPAQVGQIRRHSGFERLVYSKTAAAAPEVPGWGLAIDAAHNGAVRLADGPDGGVRVIVELAVRGPDHPPADLAE